MGFLRVKAEGERCSREIIAKLKIKNPSELVSRAILKFQINEQINKANLKKISRIVSRAILISNNPQSKSKKGKSRIASRDEKSPTS
jgi:hypothetical protein